VRSREPRTVARAGSERHPAIAPRAALTERVRQWAFEQVGEHDAAVSTVAAQLGVAWWTVMDQRGVRAGGAQERGLVHSDRRHRRRSRPVGRGEPGRVVDQFATGIADLTPGQ
jgi:hypothetical protein